MARRADRIGGDRPLPQIPPNARNGGPGSLRHPLPAAFETGGRRVQGGHAGVGRFRRVRVPHRQGGGVSARRDGRLLVPADRRRPSDDPPRGEGARRVRRAAASEDDGHTRRPGGRAARDRQVVRRRARHVRPLGIGARRAVHRVGTEEAHEREDARGLHRRDGPEDRGPRPPRPRQAHGTEVPLAAFNIASALVDSACASGRGRAPALRFGGDTVTYAELAVLQDSAARRLRVRGLERGERVALVLRDSPQFIAAFLGAAKIGAIPVPLSTLARPEELAFMERDSDATMTITDADADLFADRSGPIATAATTGDDMCFWQYSSGTTGAPKAVIHLHRRALFPAEAHGRHVARIVPADRVYSTAKLFFSYGLNNSMVIPLAAGASVVLHPERFAPDRAWRIVREGRPPIPFPVPTAYAAPLATAQAGAPPDLSPLPACVSAGEALPAPLADRWRRRFGLAILDGIGSTEIGYIAISNTVGDGTPGSSGRVVAGDEAPGVGPGRGDA